ncbi:hypothetical protein ACROYT_G035783 [Oculina patagonica]
MTSQASEYFRMMEDLDVQAFQASVSKTDVEKILRRIQAHRGVVALMVTNREGLVLRSNLDITTTKLYSAQYQKLIKMAHSAVRELDPENELCFIRVRNKEHEIMVAPTEDLILIVVQMIEKEPEVVQDKMSFIELKETIDRRIDNE